MTHQDQVFVIRYRESVAAGRPVSVVAKDRYHALMLAEVKAKSRAKGGKK